MNNESRKYILTPCARHLFSKSHAELGITVSAPPGSYGVIFGGNSHVVIQPTAAPTVTGWLAIASGCKSLTSRGATPEQALVNLKRAVRLSSQKNAAEHQRYIQSIHFAKNTDGFLDKVYEVQSRLREAIKQSSQKNDALEPLIFASLVHLRYLFEDTTVEEIEFANALPDANAPRGKRGEIGSEDAYATVKINNQLFRLSFYQFLGPKEPGEKIVIHCWAAGKSGKGWFPVPNVQFDTKVPRDGIGDLSIDIRDLKADFLEQKIEACFRKIEAFAALQTPSPSIPHKLDDAPNICAGYDFAGLVLCSSKVELC